MSPNALKRPMPLRVPPVGATALLAALIVSQAGADDFRPPQILVLNNGRVVEGRISQSAAGYVVEKATGSMVVPFDQASFAAHNLRDAYTRMHERLRYGATAETHLQTARWCVTHQLYDEARAELRSALVLDEHNREARTMLVRLDEVLRPSSTANAAEPARTPDGFVEPEARSLAGLSSETARIFVNRIQPMLLNKCGNAACHGSAADNGFRLTHTRTHRVFAERNLAMVLQFVNSDKPSESPLLVRPQGNHGVAGETIFNGPLGAEQLKALQEWVAAAVMDQRKNIDRSHILRGEKTPGDLLLISGRSSSEETQPASAAPPDDLLQRILQEEEADDFSPEEFNRRFRRGAQK